MYMNNVICYGRVSSTPRFSVNNKGQHVKCLFTLQLIRNYYCRKNDRYDIPIFMTENEQCLEVLNDVKLNDMLYIQGEYASINYTPDRPKRVVCNICSEKISISEGTATYIDVKSVVNTTSNATLTVEQGNELLIKNKRISNQIFLTGHISADIEEYIDEEKNVKVHQFPLYIEKITKDKIFKQETKKVIFPCIKLFGDIGEDKASKLQKNDTVQVLGLLSFRQPMRKVFCPCCSQDTYYKDNYISEVIPYSVGRVLKDRMKAEVENILQNFEE